MLRAKSPGQYQKCPGITKTERKSNYFSFLQTKKLAIIPKARSFLMLPGIQIGYKLGLKFGV